MASQDESGLFALITGGASAFCLIAFRILVPENYGPAERALSQQLETTGGVGMNLTKRLIARGYAHGVLIISANI
jgi:hypothetical protein